MFEELRAFPKSDKALSFEFRYKSLLKLEENILKYRSDIYEALRRDLGKSDFESEMSEVAIVLREIKYFKKNLKKLMRPVRVKTPIAHFRAKSYVLNVAHGLILIVAPWNYPINLSFTPLVGAICAGNSVVLKPPTRAKNSLSIIEKIVEETFLPEHVRVSTDRKTVLSERFDLIFFTGSKDTGRIFYEKAARDLSPCILELGGKSPVIVDRDVNLKIAAKRIVFGKFLNAGQTCVCPDYLIVHEEVLEELLGYLWEFTLKFYPDPLNNSEYPKLIDDKKLIEVVEKLKSSNLDFEADFKNRKLAPVIFKSDWNNPFMSEEIFAPVLPVLSFKERSEIFEALNHKNPLALYIFSDDLSFREEVLKKIDFGGGSINDTIVHISNDELPFGGFKDSGLGKYLGRTSFETFSHQKSIMERKIFPDIDLRYPPYGDKLKLLKKIF